MKYGAIIFFNTHCCFSAAMEKTLTLAYSLEGHDLVSVTADNNNNSSAFCSISMSYWEGKYCGIPFEAGMRDGELLLLGDRICCCRPVVPLMQHGMEAAACPDSALLFPAPGFACCTAKTKNFHVVPCLNKT